MTMLSTSSGFMLLIEEMSPFRISKPFTNTLMTVIPLYVKVVEIDIPGIFAMTSSSFLSLMSVKEATL